MELQHVNVKLLVKDPEKVDLDPVVPVFHNWIQEQVFEGQLLDVADYRHVPAGPGVILIGLDGDFSVDNSDNRLGVRYNRKAALEGSNQERLHQATYAALSAFELLQAEQSLEGQFNFNGQDIEISINDRLLAPNQQETRNIFQSDFQDFSDKLFGVGRYSLAYNEDPRRLFTVSLRASQSVSVEQLLANLS